MSGRKTKFCKFCPFVTYRKEDTRSNLLCKDCGWRLKENVCSEEYQSDDRICKRVAIWNKWCWWVHLELGSHASDGGIGQVGTIHERDTVHQAHSNDKTTINTANDVPLLGWRELGLHLALEVGVGRVLPGVLMLSDGGEILLAIVIGGHGDVVVVESIRGVEGSQYTKGETLHIHGIGPPLVHPCKSLEQRTRLASTMELASRPAWPPLVRIGILAEPTQFRCGIGTADTRFAHPHSLHAWPRGNVD